MKLPAPEHAQFDVDVTLDDCRRFADLSGDWNPLHTDAAHAAASIYGRQVLHGAFSAGLISRLAGMYLPGKDCLLHGLRLRFVTPILPPASLRVSGRVVSSSAEVGRVEATVSDAVSGAQYVEASYEFGLHRMAATATVAAQPSASASRAVVLVTGASGGLGIAVLRLLGDRGRGVSRTETGELRVDNVPANTPIAAIVHCDWPTPDNRRFLDLDDPAAAIQHHVAGPLRDIQVLARWLANHGIALAPLVLVGSTFARPGRHYFRMPLYSVAKSTIPTLVEILALELAGESKRCFGVVFDVLDGGMNKAISDAARMANADRSPWGELATPADAAGQILWLLENQSTLLSGATLTLSAGAIP